MNNNKEYQLYDVNKDVFFFFLLLMSAFISFDIIINKKKKMLNIPYIGIENMNKLFKFNHILQVIINIYFVINAYQTLEVIISKGNYNSEQYDTQLTILVSNVLLLVASIMYLPILDSDYVLTR